MQKKYHIDFPKSARKSLRRISLPWRERIGKAIELLQYNPLIGEKMWGKLKGKRKLRIWPYRVVYKIDKKSKKIIVLEIGHRGGIYK